MILNLKNLEFKPSGIFGVLLVPSSGIVFMTLQHAYLDESREENIYQPKVPRGMYPCVRGEHLLHGSSEPFETFEITGVKDHTGILFHPGNTERDSEGCVLLGMSRVGDSILDSKIAFRQFMSQLEGLNNFQLVVE